MATHGWPVVPLVVTPRVMLFTSSVDAPNAPFALGRVQLGLWMTWDEPKREKKGGERGGGSSFPVDAPLWIRPVVAIGMEQMSKASITPTYCARSSVICPAVAEKSHLRAPVSLVGRSPLC